MRGCRIERSAVPATLADQANADRGDHIVHTRTIDTSS